MLELNDKYFCAFNDSKDKKIFRLSNTARKIFWVARIFDATLPNFTIGRAIAPPAPLVSYAYGRKVGLKVEDITLCNLTACYIAISSELFPHDVDTKSELFS